MTLDLEAIKARAEAATEGPLYSEANEHNDAFDLCNQPGRWDSSETKVYLECDPADTTFITAAYTDIPALVAEVERLRLVLSHVEVDRDHYRDESLEVERLRAIVDRVRAFCSDPCTENCCAACDGQNVAYRQVLTILDAMEDQ